jgi:MbtH protein
MSDDGSEIYKVLVNEEEQYTIWPEARDIPTGWREAGKTGTEEECEAYVAEVWTDMRPRSMRTE